MFRAMKPVTDCPGLKAIARMEESCQLHIYNQMYKRRVRALSVASYYMKLQIELESTYDFLFVLTPKGSNVFRMNLMPSCLKFYDLSPETKSPKI